MTSGRKSSAVRRLSDESDDLSNAEAFEIAIEMSSGEPLQLSNKMLLEHLVLSEYALACREPIDGLYVSPSHEDLTVWFGVLFIRRGVYMGAVLRFTLNLPPDFGLSSVVPNVVFDLKVFHPHIDVVTKELDLNRYFSDGWKPERHHIYHVLLVVQRTFFSFDADALSCRNPEAALMLQNNKEGFMAKAREIIRESRSTVYDPLPTSDLHAIRFFPWDMSVHEPLRQRLTGSLTESQISTSSLLGSFGCSSVSTSSGVRGRMGLSWVSPTEGLFMVEQPRLSGLESPVENDTSGCEEKIVNGTGPCLSLNNGR